MQRGTSMLGGRAGGIIIVRGVHCCSGEAGVATERGIDSRKGQSIEYSSTIVELGIVWNVCSIAAKLFWSTTQPPTRHPPT